MILLAGSAGLIFYVFFGYPLLVRVLARIRPRPVRDDAGYTAPVSVIVAARNEAAVIDRKLENSFQLDYPQELLEVIVVDDGSDDGTAARAERHPRASVIRDPVWRGKSVALTCAVEHSRGEILVFSDADSLLTPGTLRALLAKFADPDVGCVTGRRLIEDTRGRSVDAAEGLYWRYESAIRTGEARFGSVSGVNGDLLAVRRQAFTALPAGTVNDDFVLAMEAASAGWRVAYAPDAVSVQPASASTGDEARRKARMAAGRIQALLRVSGRLVRRDPLFAWQVLSHKALRLAVPFALAGALVGNALLLGEARWAPLLLAFQLLFYAAALAGWYQERRSRVSKLLYLPYFFCRMNGATVRGLARFMFEPGTRIARWERVTRGDHT